MASTPRKVTIGRIQSSLACLLPSLVFTFWVLQCVANPLDLGVLKGSNSTKDNNKIFPGTSIVNTTNSLDDLLGCFRQSPHQEPQFFRTNFKDCFHAEKMIVAHNPRRPIHFRRNNDSTFVLPNSFTYRTCLIYLDMVSANAEDFFYLSQVKDVVLDTARRCTSRPEALGGQSMVGPRKLMLVEVLGRP